MSYTILKSIISILFLTSVHLWAVKDTINLWRKKLFSFAGGISVAYVFVDLLPKLSKGQAIWSATNPNLPFLEKHVYFLALLGVLFFFGIEHVKFKHKSRSFWSNSSGNIIFNILIGYALSNPSDPEVQPFILFTIAISLHQWVRDHILCSEDAKTFKRFGRYVLVLALITGWILGLLINLNPAAVALIMAFIGGGIMINIFHYEVPSKSTHYLPFVVGSLGYALLLLFLGK